MADDTGNVTRLGDRRPPPNTRCVCGSEWFTLDRAAVVFSGKPGEAWSIVGWTGHPRCVECGEPPEGLPAEIDADMGYSAPLRAVDGSVDG